MDTSPKIICSANKLSSRKVNFSFGHQDLTSQQNTIKALLETFVQLGGIQSLQLWSNSEYTSGNILFGEPQNAVQLLSQSGRLFAGAIVCFWEDSNVFHLNDYCLQKIFSFLKTEDLFSVAQVNERFKENAQIVFPLKHTAFRLSFGIGTHNQPWNRDFHQFQNFVRIFGAFIDSIGINGAQASSTIKIIADLLLRYSSDSIKNMDLCCFEREDALILGPLFPGLVHLHINDLKNVSDAFFDLLKGCHELRSLHFDHTTGVYESLQFNLPKLETITFESCRGVEPHQMKKFLEINPQLKEVMIEDCGDVGENICSMIGKHLPRIEKIGICGSNWIMQPSRNQNAFASLKKLRIEASPNSCAAVLRQLSVAKAPLAYLHLWSPTNDKLIDAICDLKTINTLYLGSDGVDVGYKLPISSCLRICECLEELTDLFVDRCGDLDANGLVQIVQTATNLQNLRFYYNAFEIDEDAYNSLVEILEKRAVKIPLKIYMNTEDSDLTLHQTHKELLTFHGCDDSDCLQFLAFFEME